MKNVTNYVHTHKLTFMMLICSCLFIVLQADGCMGGGPTPSQTNMTVFNNSSAAVKGVVICNDYSSSFLLDAGSKTFMVLSCSNMSYTLVVRPVDDWLAFAKQKRDSLITKLSDAKSTGNAADIASITDELEAIQTKISSLQEHGGKASCTGMAIGDPQVANISDGLYTYSLAVLCHTYAP